MKKLDRILRAKQQRRDEAVAKLTEAQQRLAALQRDEAALTQKNRDQLTQRASGQGMTVNDLEKMDLIRQGADLATQRQSHQVGEAKANALKSNQQLRQLEVLRDRMSAADKQRDNKLEQKALDEATRRLKNNKSALMLAVGMSCLQVVSACNQLAEANTAPQGQTASTATASAATTAVPSGACRDLSACGDAVEKLKQIASQTQQDVSQLKQRLNAAIAQIARVAAGVNGSSGGEWQAEEKKPVYEGPVNLIAVVRKMNTRAASAVLAEVDPGVAAAVLRVLAADHAGRILANIPPEQAAPIAERLHGRASRPSGSNGHGKKDSGDGDADEEDSVSAPATSSQSGAPTTSVPPLPASTPAAAAPTGKPASATNTAATPPAAASPPNKGKDNGATTKPSH